MNKEEEKAKKEFPLITVIIPTYNRAKTIKKAVESVLSQTYKKIECIIIDDGSNDNTEQVVKTIKDKRVKYIKIKHGGACVARNAGIKRAKGEYIAFQDSDDEWYKNKLERQLAEAKTHNADIIFCKTNIPAAYNYSEGFIDPKISVYNISTQTIMAKKAIFKKVKFDPEFTKWQDMDFLYSASFFFTIYCIDEILVKYNLSEDSISINHSDIYYSVQKFIKKHPECLGKKSIMKEEMANVLLNLCKNEKKIKVLKLTLKCSKSPKIIIKTILYFFHLYPLK